MKILVTGGAGFIGSNFIKYVLTNSEVEDKIKVINIDKQTYAAKGKNIEHMGLDNNKKYKFVRGDICDKSLVEKLFSQEEPDLVFNFAAESHVDKSIQSSEDFVMTNIVGTANLLDIAKKNSVMKFVQISTDEVYGSLISEDKPSKETDPLCPRSPYSASKAAAEHLTLAYFHTHGLPAIITRSANNYGPYQFPEKLLPLFITNLIEDKKVPLMWSKENPSLNVRDWLYVEDNCRAIWFVAQKGDSGETYNIPGENEKTNMEMTKLLLENFGVWEERIQYIPHRLGHDFKYSISGEKLKALGFKYKYEDLKQSIEKTIEWYRQNEDWWRPLKK